MLTQAEIRARVAKFAEDWKNEDYEKGETHSFYDAFFLVFGIGRRSVAVYEKFVRKLNDTHGFIDLFWPRKLLVEQKSAGRSLEKAMEQAEDYFTFLEEEQRPRYLLACDFQSFQLVDLEENKEDTFMLSELPQKIGLFNFMTDRKNRGTVESYPVSIKASEMMGRIYDSLKATGYPDHDTEYLLTRLAFCLFADDTGIFEDGTFSEYLKCRTSSDGSDLGAKMIQMFQVLDTPDDSRQTTLDASLAQFPYIDGDLFRKQISIPAFDSGMRHLLIEAGEFDWSKVSPAIFGSLFQSVMDKEKRRSEGAHYTTEENIMKVIRPLFLDDLEDEFKNYKNKKGRNRKIGLEMFQDKLAGLAFFDPACGAGNFLIIAYREIRRLELKVIHELHHVEPPRIDVSILSKVDVDQFYGIEKSEFSAKIAETAIWMMDHIMNNELGAKYGIAYARIPLKKSPSIRQADALEIDWNDILPSSECSYILGNPPFGGPKHATKERRQQIINIANLGKSGGTLDYVSGWFLKAAGYVGNNAKIGFVATNSITQGEQVGQLWPILFEKHGMEIAFAYVAFKWRSEAKKKAQVHVVILGLTKRGTSAKKRLFHIDDDGNTLEDNPVHISPYLFGTEDIRIVRETSKQLNRLPTMRMGSQPIDGGNYIFSDEEKAEFVHRETGAEPFMREYIGANEYIKGTRRWILALQKVSPAELNRLPEVKKRVEMVRKYRQGSKRASTKKLAKTPTFYQADILPQKSFLVIPEVSSERRLYVPIGYMKSPIIPSNKLRVVEDADIGLFGLLVSEMHMVWLRYVGGRMKSDFSYSIDIVYKTFPVPNGNLAFLKKQARLILDIRKKYADSTLEDLYDPLTMPRDLWKAHHKLDLMVERMYRKERFMSDHERLEFLLEKYYDMVQQASDKLSEPEYGAKSET